MQQHKINFTMPQGWHELSRKQLRFLYKLIAANFTSEEIKMLCLFKWNNIKVVGRQKGGSFLLQHHKQLFEVSAISMAEILPLLDWITLTPPIPVRPDKINRCRALPADFDGVPFESFIVCDNYFQGYLQTKDDLLLDEVGRILYQNPKAHFLPWQRVAIFYWMISIKDFFARKFPDFFKSVDSASGGNLLGASPASVEEAMNAQIRALTKGDITKEAQVLALDTWRALTELNAQAREYKELNQQLKK